MTHAAWVVAYLALTAANVALHVGAEADTYHAVVAVFCGSAAGFHLWQAGER